MAVHPEYSYSSSQFALRHVTHQTIGQGDTMFIPSTIMKTRVGISSALWMAVLSLWVVGRVAAQPSGASSDWPQFLGPHRNGLSDETGLLDSFPAQGPKIVWRVPGGVGM